VLTAGAHGAKRSPSLANDGREAGSELCERDGANKSYDQHPSAASFTFSTVFVILFKHPASAGQSLFMAKKSVIARSLKKPKFSSRIVRRCFRCGRKNGFMRDFGLCRICFREYANEGMIPGIKKSSW